MSTLLDKNNSSNIDVGNLLSRMTLAYVLASCVLCATLVFSYFILNNVLNQQHYLNKLASDTVQLQLVIRDSAFHMAELKAVRAEGGSGSRLELKIERKLRLTLQRLVELKTSIENDMRYFEGGALKNNILPLFYETPKSMISELDDYLRRLSELADKKNSMTPGLDTLWLPVEASAAIDGSLVQSIGYAATSLRGVISEQSDRLSATHIRLSLFAVSVVLLELIALFMPLSALLKKANARLLTAHDELYKQANYDAETSLANRRGLIESVGEKTQQTNNGLLIIRIQKVDKIHNIAGPEAMGQVFSQLGRRIESAVGPGNRVFRTGDNEFAALLNCTHDRASAAVLIKSLQTELVLPMKVGSVQLYPEVALGYDKGAVMPDNAENKLINARLAARNYVASVASVPMYDPAMRKRIQDDSQLAEKIRAALINHEFVPFYQIKVDSITGQPTGMEALCRWVQPDGSVISPFHFISIAETSGLIAELTWQMLEQIIEDWKHWTHLGLEPGRVAFNAAQSFLIEPDCCARFKNLIADMGCEQCPIDLEVTENVALPNNSTQVSATLDEFRKLGVPIALDDFGTGYASLSSIVSMNIDVVKVDQQFVRKMTECRNSRNVVVAILNLCKFLDKKSVVEGVETIEQMHACQRMGCDEIQGYYFYKPDSYAGVTQALLDASQSPRRAI